MPNEKSAIDQFLAGEDDKSLFPKEDKNPFASLDTTTEEPEEKEESEKPLPFHKDPKVQRYVEKQIAKAMESIKPSETEKFTKETEDEISDVLVRIIGNDTPEKISAVKDFRKVLGSLEERGAQKALQEFQAQAERATEQDRRAQAELDESFEEIEETYGVDLSSNAPTARKARSEFVDYIRKIAPKNEDGEVSAFPDLVSAFEEFQERSKRTQPVNRAKELASRSMSRSTDASVEKATGDKSWKSVERLFSKLSN